MKLSSFLVGLYLLAPFISAQDDYYGDGGGDYNDYGGDYGDYGQQDNLYQNYADRQENKA